MNHIMTVAALMTLGACSSEGLASTPEPAVAQAAEQHTEAADGQPASGLLGDWLGWRSSAADAGLDWSILYIGEALANIRGGLRQGLVYEGLLKAAVDLDTQRARLWSDGKFHISGLYPHGKGLTKRHLGDLFTFSNIDAPDEPRLFEFWYEHSFLNDRVSLRLGQLAADEEFAYTSCGSSLINSPSGWLGIIAVNVPAPAYPVGTPGARLAAKLGGGWTVQTAIYNGQPMPTDDEGRFRNENGIYYKIRDAFGMTEVMKEWSCGSEESPLPGMARAGAWYHTGNFADQHEDENGVSLHNPASTGVPREHGGNWGVFVAAEQRVFTEAGQPDQGLGLFGRAGFAPPEKNPLELYLEGGVAWTGLLPGRDADVLALGVVYGCMSRHSRALARDYEQLEGEDTALPDHEMLLEIGYSFVLRPGFILQPVAGWIMHPGGSKLVQDAVVAGARFTLEF